MQYSQTILADELSQEDRKQIINDSIGNYNTYINSGWLKYRKSVSTNAAFIEWRDEGDCFYDVNGEEFIDCLGGFGIYMCGHRNPEILKYTKAQLDRQALHSQELVDPLRGYLARVLAEITPGDLQHCFFTNGGAEAVEMAIKLARIATGGRWFISTLNHGKSMGAVSVGGKSTYRVPYIPMVQQVQHVEYGNAEDMRKAVRNLVHVGEKVAAGRGVHRGKLRPSRKAFRNCIRQSWVFPFDRKDQASREGAQRKSNVLP